MGSSCYLTELPVWCIILAKGWRNWQKMFIPEHHICGTSIQNIDPRGSSHTSFLRKERSRDEPWEGQHWSACVCRCRWGSENVRDWFLCKIREWGRGGGGGAHPFRSPRSATGMQLVSSNYDFFPSRKNWWILGKHWKYSLLTHVLHIDYIMMLFFSRSEWISRDNDVTIVLALNRISALIRIFSENALCYVYFGCLPSAVRSFTKIYQRNFEIF